MVFFESKEEPGMYLDIEKGQKLQEALLENPSFIKIKGQVIATREIKRVVPQY